MHKRPPEDLFTKAQLVDFSVSKTAETLREETSWLLKLTPTVTVKAWFHLRFGVEEYTIQCRLGLASPCCQEYLTAPDEYAGAPQCSACLEFLPTLGEYRNQELDTPYFKESLGTVGLRIGYLNPKGQDRLDAWLRRNLDPLETILAQVDARDVLRDFYRAVINDFCRRSGTALLNPLEPLL